MRWPWEWGRRTGPAGSGSDAASPPTGPTDEPRTPAAAPAQPEPGPRAWAVLPPVQRSMAGFEPAVTPPDAFRSSLATHQNPSLLAPLGHLVDADGPSGVVGGLASSAGQPVPYEGAVELRVPDRPPAKPVAPVQRQILTLHPEPPAAPEPPESPGSSSAPEFSGPGAPTVDALPVAEGQPTRAQTPALQRTADQATTDTQTTGHPSASTPPQQPAVVQRSVTGSESAATPSDPESAPSAPLVSSLLPDRPDQLDGPSSRALIDGPPVLPNRDQQSPDPAGTPLVVARLADPSGGTADSRSPLTLQSAAAVPSVTSTPPSTGGSSGPAATGAEQFTVQRPADDHTPDGRTPNDHTGHDPTGHDHPGSEPAPTGPGPSVMQRAADTDAAGPVTDQPTLGRSAAATPTGPDAPLGPIPSSAPDPLTVPVQRATPSAPAAASPLSDSGRATLRPVPTDDAARPPAPSSPAFEVPSASEGPSASDDTPASDGSRPTAFAAPTSIPADELAVARQVADDSDRDHAEAAADPAGAEQEVAAASAEPVITGLLADGPSMITDAARSSSSASGAPTPPVDEGSVSVSPTAPLTVPTPSVAPVQRLAAGEAPTLRPTTGALTGAAPTTGSSAPTADRSALRSAETEFPPLVARTVQRSQGADQISVQRSAAGEQAPLSGFAAAISALQGQSGPGPATGSTDPAAGAADLSTSTATHATGGGSADLVVARQAATDSAARSSAYGVTPPLTLSAQDGFPAPTERASLVVARRVAPDSSGQLPPADAVASSPAPPSRPAVPPVQRSLIAELPPLIRPASSAGHQAPPPAPAVQRLRYEKPAGAPDHDAMATFPTSASPLGGAPADQPRGAALTLDTEPYAVEPRPAPWTTESAGGSWSGTSSGGNLADRARSSGSPIAAGPASTFGVQRSVVPAAPPAGPPADLLRGPASSRSEELTVSTVQRQFDASPGSGTPSGASGEAAVGVAGRTVGLAEMFALAAAQNSLSSSAGEAEPASVQRSADTEVQRAEEVAPAAAPSAAPPAAAGPAGAAPAALSGAQLEEMARRLYDPLSARLRAELWQDRERAGLLTDLRP